MELLEKSCGCELYRQDPSAPVPLTAWTEPFIFSLEADDWNHGACTMSVWCVGSR